MERAVEFESVGLAGGAVTLTVLVKLATLSGDWNCVALAVGWVGRGPSPASPEATLYGMPGPSCRLSRAALLWRHLLFSSLPSL